MREMKDSGIAWIKKIPVTWDIVRTKYNFSHTKTIAGIYADDYERLALTLGGVVKRSKEDNNGLQPEKFETYQILKKDELVFKLIDLQNISTSRVGISPYVGLVSPAYIVIKATGKISPQYAEKYFLSLWKNQVFNALGDSGVRSSLNAKDLLEIPILVPPLSEQQAISAYLDKKCSEIDSLTADIQKQIETLEEYKRSVITEAVTKGLNPDAEMKDSGYQWNPEIPKHWHTIPAKYLFQSSDVRKHPDDVQLTASQKYGIISQKEYMERENAKIVFANQGIENWKHVAPNDFIISLRSFQGGLELSETTGCITWHYIVLKAVKPMNYRFFKWLFKSSKYINALQGTCNFIRDGQDLRYSNFIQVPLYQPPLDEQQQIADYLDQKCTQIDGIISDKKKQLETLEEYKKSLIFEYVTGKREVNYG